VARASNTPLPHSIHGRMTEAFLLQLATLCPLGENGYVSEHHGYVDTD
jgi:hypothetical protein